MFKYKKPIVEKLKSYGFVRKNGEYAYNTPIMDGQFVLRLTVTDGAPRYTVIDAETGESYTLVHNENVQGAFVGSVRAECERVLSDIAEKCYITDVFREKQTKEIISYMQEKYGIFPEQTFADSPDIAVFRKPSGKWCGIIMVVKSEKLGLPSGALSEIMNLKASPEEVVRLTAEGTVIPAYHMNKKHWITVRLDGSLPIESILELVDKSHKIVR